MFRNHHPYMQATRKLVGEYKTRCLDQWHYFEQTGVVLDSLECRFCKEYIKTLGLASKSDESISRNHH